MKLRRRPKPITELGPFEPWPKRERRSLNPFPPLLRATRAGALGLVHENTLIMYVAIVAMAISYQGLVSFASEHGLPSPWVWPIPFDLAAFALARMAWKLHRLGHAAGIIRLSQHGLVAMSVTLQVSMVNLAGLPESPTQSQFLLWGWQVLPQIIGHGMPAVIADGLFEAALLLKRVGNKRAPATKPEPRKLKETKPTQTDGVDQQTPEAGQSRPTPSVLAAAGREDQGEAAAPLPGPDVDESLALSPDEVALADQVAAVLREDGAVPTKRTVRPAVLQHRATASSDLVLKINRYLQSHNGAGAH
jgi:hypothetical protein